MDSSVSPSQSLIHSVLNQAVKVSSSPHIEQLSPKQQMTLIAIIQNTDNILTHYQPGANRELDRDLTSIHATLGGNTIGANLGITPPHEITERLLDPEAAYRKHLLLDFQALLPAEVFNKGVVQHLENLPSETRTLINQLMWAHFDLSQKKDTSNAKFLEAHLALTEHLENPHQLEPSQVDCIKFLCRYVSKQHLNLTPEEVVESILQKEKMAYQEMADAPRVTAMERLFFFEKTDEDWEKQKSLYLKIENWVRENNSLIPSWEVAGPLNYSMTRDEMKVAITQKLQEMAKSGKLMTEQTLHAKHDRKTLFPPPERKATNLTRIWGAEFLKAHLSEEPALDSPEHFLILNEGATAVEVKAWPGSYLSLNAIDNGYVLAEKIKGTPCARDFITSEALKKPMFTDFTGSDNILRDSDGISWVVDTEFKSFAPPELKVGALMVHDYLKKRFEILVEQDYRSSYLSFKIPLSTLGIK